MKYQKELNPGGDLEVKLEQDGSDISYYYNFTISSHMLDAAKYPRLILADCIREARQHIRKAIYDQQQQRVIHEVESTCNSAKNP